MKRKTPLTPPLATVHGQPSWRFGTGKVEACLTPLGGHLGPVTFRLGRKRVQPFSVTPWAEEEQAAKLVPILRVLRGDFFCMPFGGNATPWHGEQHPIHGETANGHWRLESFTRQAGRVCLHASLKTRIRPGQVDKRICLCPGETAVYCQHTVSAMKGPMNLGHHAMLRFPEAPNSGLISTSPFLYGLVLPTPFEQPAERGYSSLQVGAEFASLSAVPLAVGGSADLSRYPARRGFEDLVIMVSDPKLPFAWTAVVFPQQRYVWFALKNPRILGQTMFWLSNGGRHYPPWNGRHVGVMGLEELTSYFAYGLAEAVRPNPLSQKGFPTVIQLDPRRPLVVPYIMAMTEIPARFDHVRDIRPDPDQPGVVLVSASGQQARAALHLEFLEADSAW